MKSNLFPNNLMNREPDFGIQKLSKDSFLGAMKKNLIGIPNINLYMNSLNFIQKKLLNEENYGFHPISHSESEKISFLSESIDTTNNNNKNYIFQKKFNLLDYIIERNKVENFISQAQLNQYFYDFRPNHLVYNGLRRKKAIEKYKNKKKMRKNSKFVRYKIRKELAEKRKRHKGKFIKNKKIDMQKALKDFLKEQKLEKEMKKLNI